MLEAAVLLRRYWYFAVIFVLVFAVLYLRGDNASLQSDADKAEAKAATLQAVNDSNAKIIKGFAEQRIANDAIIQRLADVKAGNATREVTTRTIIEREKRNDPAVRSWSDTAVPDSLRRAINAPSD